MWWAFFVLQWDTKGHRNMNLEDVAAQNKGSTRDTPCPDEGGPS